MGNSFFVVIKQELSSLIFTNFHNNFDYNCLTELGEGWAPVVLDTPDELTNIANKAIPELRELSDKFWLFWFGGSTNFHDNDPILIQPLKYSDYIADESGN